MLNIIIYSGPYGPILALLGLVVLFLTLQSTLILLRGGGVPHGILGERLNALLFWGVVAALLGFLGQCQGSFQALSEILRATEISPGVVAEGFSISFVPTLFGLGILALSLAAWGCLKLLSRGRKPGVVLATPSLFLLLLLVTGCSGVPGQGRPTSLSEGVWAMDAGPDQFLWDFQVSDGAVTCVVHDIQGSRKLNETPCRSAELEGSTVKVSMDTGVQLEGEVQLDRGRLLGHLRYPNGESNEVELPWAPKASFPALEARPGASAPYAYGSPEGTRDGWPVASAGAEGVDPGGLEEMVAAVERGEMGVLHSLLVARHGHLILEEYFHGYGPGDLHHLASCTKSVSSLLVGLAIDEGKISGVDAPILSFFPEDRASAGPGWENLTLKELLTMSLALDWSPAEAQNLHGTGPEFFRRVLSRSVAGTPGKDFEYVSANVNLIAGILRQATGEQAEAFAQRTLFRPLGIEEWNWDPMKTQGYNLMDGSLRLLPRDMAKLGQMMLDGGTWQGTRVVSRDWVEASTTRYLDAGEGSEGYGYLWWLMEAPGPSGEPIPAFFANGWGSQFIVVFPTLDLLVVTTGGNEYNGKHLSVADALVRYLLPAVHPE